MTTPWGNLTFHRTMSSPFDLQASRAGHVGTRVSWLVDPGTTESLLMLAWDRNESHRGQQEHVGPVIARRAGRAIRPGVHRP